ncbi:UNVERIFIED_CONTAM: hypothetical protein Sradi_0447800 [Sesamum radiatum]|uniref:Reverse transcriptase Ty1/copia-type domain-containing protein n=1 Tax=Sesamum radiatum TaxID=300843 RepID=A0AAW2W7Y1_SESRA
MNQELLALERNQTWDVVPLLSGKRVIGCKWVYKIKLKDDGSVDHYKARLVAKGYTQVEGVDYIERLSLLLPPLPQSLKLHSSTDVQLDDPEP